MHTPPSPLSSRSLAILVLCASSAMAVKGQTPERTEPVYPSVVVKDAPLEYRQFEKVEITGSSIVRKEQTQALPVLSVTREDIRRSGRQSLTEVVQSLPSMSNYVESAQFSKADGGFASGAIHGLSNGTLILVNGRRLAPYGLQTMAGPERSAVSLNTIPLGDVERIEVLTDGASSLYGSDAIAGVINIILRNERKGFEISAQGLSPDQNKGAGWTTQMGWGQGQLRRDGYSVLVSAELSHQKALLGQDRPYASQGAFALSQDGKNYKAFGLSDYLTLSTAPASYFQASPSAKFTNSFGQEDGSCVPGTLSYIPSTGPAHCRRNSYLDLGIYPEQESQKVRTQVQIALDGGHTWFMEGIYGQMSASRPSSLWPSLTLTASETDRPQIVAGGLTPSRTTVFWRPDLPSLDMVLGEKNWQLSTGVSGETMGWDYRAVAYKSQAQAYRAVETVLTTDYPKLSAFTRPNLITPLDDANPLTAQLMSVRSAASTWERGKTGLTALELRGSRALYEMNGKDILLGAGLDWRQEETVYRQVIDIDGPESFDGTRRVLASYAELMVPLTDDWEINFGLRRDNYNDVGTTTNGKISTRWVLNSQWSLRGAVGTGFRAPVVGQTQLLENDFRWAKSTFTNPCTAELVAIASSLTNAQGQAGSCKKFVFDEYGNGNPDLKPEKSQQGTLGVAFVPHPNLRMSMDYWRVKIRDGIDFVSDTAVVENPNAHKDNFTLNGNNELALFLPLQNVGQVLKSGIDLEMQWRKPTDFGRFSFLAQGTYMLSSQYRGTKTSALSSDLGRFNLETNVVIPRFKTRMTASLTRDAWTGNLSVNHVSGYIDADVRATNLDSLKVETVSGRRVPSFTTWDVTMQYALNTKTDLRLAVLNALNQDAPLSFSQTSTQVFGANTMNSNLWGRTIQLGMTLRF